MMIMNRCIMFVIVPAVAMKSPATAIEPFPSPDLDVDAAAAENCVLYLWTTPPKVGEEFQVLASWTACRGRLDV